MSSPHHPWAQLPAGATGTTTIFAGHVKVAHIIRRVTLRMTALLSYVNQFRWRNI